MMWYYNGNTSDTADEVHGIGEGLTMNGYRTRRAGLGAAGMAVAAVFALFVATMLSAFGMAGTALADDEENFGAQLISTTDMQDTGITFDLLPGDGCTYSASGGTITVLTAQLEDDTYATAFANNRTTIWPSLVGMEYNSPEYRNMKFYRFKSNNSAASNGAAGASFTVRWKNAAVARDIKTGKQTMVDIKCTFTIRNSGIGDEDVPGYSYLDFCERFDWGVFNFNTVTHDQKFEFYYAGSNTPYVLPGNAFVYQGSMDKGEGISASGAVNAQVSSDAPITNPFYRNSSSWPEKYDGIGWIGDRIGTDPNEGQWHSVPGTYVYELSDSDVGEGESAFRGYLGVRNMSGDYDFVDNKEDSAKTVFGHNYENTYNWRAASIETNSTGKSSFTVRHYSVGTNAWPRGNTYGVNDPDAKTSPYRDAGSSTQPDGYDNYGTTYYNVLLRPLATQLPPPPYKMVNKAQVETDQDILTYTVTKTINQTGLDTMLGSSEYHYTDFGFADTLDPNVTYVDGSFKVTQGSTNLTSQGTLNYNATTNKLTFSMNENQCKRLAYDGTQVIFTFKVKVKQNVPLNKTIDNKATTITNGYEQESNKVTTIGPPQPPVKSVDKTTAVVDELVEYTVVQESRDKFLYTAFTFSDPIPAKTEYVDGSLKVYDKSGNDITAAAGSGKCVNGTLTYTFKSGWLTANQDATEKFTFKFKVKALEESANGSFTNRAVTNINSGQWVQRTNDVTTSVPVWYVKVKKASGWPALLTNNPAYSLEGAVFSVKDSSGENAGALTTDANGDTETVTVVRPGTATVTELEAPAGHMLPSPVSKTVTLNNSNVSQTLTVNFTDPEITLDIPVIAHKVDSDYLMMGDRDQDRTNAQGNSPSLAGCKVRVDFYAGSKPTGTRLASAVFQSDADGAIKFSTGTPVDGTSWAYRKNGKNLLPLGCVTVTEIAAPEGYDVDPTVHVATIVQQGDEAVLVPGSEWK